MWLGVDDTDSREGMCTTHLAGDLIAAINHAGLDVIGYPRLVRLNPTVPWKTRGNGAIAIQFGRGGGGRHLIGQVEGKRYGRERLRAHGDTGGLFPQLVEVVRRRARLDTPGTNPGLVMSRVKPPVALYRRAVHHIVGREEVAAVLEDAGAVYRGFNDGRGIIGAAAALAWRPGDATYEVITYRNGGRRWVDEESVRHMDRRCPDTFDNYDYLHRHVKILPASPCPVLYGIRGESPEGVREAMHQVASSPVRRWLLFQTNQATDAHLEKTGAGEVRPFSSVAVTGTVFREPRTIRGGHVLFEIRDATGGVDCAAYEPTKEFRDVVRRLRRGDVVTVCGGVRKEPLTVNLEKMCIRRLAKIREKRENPVCPDCGKHMKSAGGGQGYRCARCGRRAGEEAARMVPVERGLHCGWYEVPVVARRHLAKPLRRMGVEAPAPDTE